MESYLKPPNLVELIHCSCLQMFFRPDGQLSEVVLCSTVNSRLSVLMGPNSAWITLKQSTLYTVPS